MRGLPYRATCRGRRSSFRRTDGAGGFFGIESSRSISLAASAAVIARDFVPWRFSDAGRPSAWNTFLSKNTGKLNSGTTLGLAVFEIADLAR
jgi:hypothetical protein